MSKENRYVDYSSYAEAEDTRRKAGNCAPKEEEDLWPVTEEEKEWMCRAFTLLDVDGDGVIDLPELEFMLLSWGRLPFDENLAQILTYSGARGQENVIGMDFDGFKNYVSQQLFDTGDEEELRRAFQIFDSSPPTGKVNVKELRHYLKTKSMTLTDDEIDFLYREEDYWMLEEKDHIEYEKLISKLMDKPTCDSKFLNC